jgi:NAD+ kinase
MKLSRVLLITNDTKPDAVRAATEIAAWCLARKIACATVALPIPQAPEAVGCAVGGDGTVACALGGDGTVLRAAALVAEAGIPILGVNVGSLGFLSRTSLELLFPTLERIARGEYEIDERMRLAYSAGDVRGTVLNDVVVAGVTPRLLEIRLAWREGVAVTLSGDGLIVATPTGTTAYSLSLGGPIAVPTAECVIVTPHAAHLLGLRSLVFSRDDELRVSAPAEVRLVADGDEVGRIAAGTEIVVRRADAPTRLVRPSGAPGFFETLTTKLNWPGPADRRRTNWA